MSSEGYSAAEGALDASGLRFGVVVSRFNAFITEKLLAGAVDALREHGARQDDITVVHVSGAFEIPAVATALAARSDIDAVVTIGCLIRGDTFHFELIANECTRGLAELARTCGKAVSFGVITTDTREQALDRAGGRAGNKGAEAALAAVEQASVLAALARDNPTSTEAAGSRQRK